MFIHRALRSVPLKNAVVIWLFTASLFFSIAFAEHPKQQDGSSDSNVVTVDFEKTLQKAKAEPIVEDEKTIGFKLSQVKGDSVYSKMGLQSGDIVKSINGVELRDAAQAIQTLNSLKNETTVEVKFTRAGKVETRRIEVK